MNEAENVRSSEGYGVDQEVLGATEDLQPELKEALVASLAELQQNLQENRAASVRVFHGSKDSPIEDEKLARQVLMAGLGVKDHQVTTFRKTETSGELQYQERILTNIPGVEIVYSDAPDGGRWISLAVNHDLSGITRTSPTDIERVLRTTRTRGEWIKSVEAYGGHWNTKRDRVKAAKLLSIDIDECIYPEVDRRAPDDQTIQSLAEKFKLLSESMKIILNTNRSAPETTKVLEDFERRGVTIRGAVTEGGAIMIEKDELGAWQMKRNPDISEEDWNAMQATLSFIRREYLDKNIGHAEPKVTALTFDLNPEAGITGHQVLAKIREELVRLNLPTTIVDRGADVSDGGLQLLAGIDKAVGMRYIQGLEGIEKGECLSIGDSKSDLPMFAESGITASPYNAARELKVESDYYSPFDAEYGILDIVSQVEQIKRTPD